MAAFGSVASHAKRFTCIAKSNPALSSRCVSTLPLIAFPSPSTLWPQLNKRSAQESLQSKHNDNIICRGDIAGSTSFFRRTLSNPSSWEAEYEGLIAQRNKSIIMHPEGHGQKILPGNYVIKKNERTGAEKKVFLEHALGYFWAIKVCIWRYWYEYDFFVMPTLLNSRYYFLRIWSWQTTSPYSPTKHSYQLPRLKCFPV